MIKNSIVQLYFRRILLDGLEHDAIQIPIQYENVDEDDGDEDDEDDSEMMTQ